MFFWDSSQEYCMYCGCDFDPDKHHYQEDWNSINTSERVRAAFTVRCPNCGIAFMSEGLKLFGLFTFARSWMLYRLDALAFCIFAWWSSRTGW
jgi:hypothetical protein